MVTELLLAVAQLIATWVQGLFPPLPTDNLLDGLVQLATIGQYVGSLSVWVNWLALAAQVAFVLGTYFTFLGVRIARALIGHVPLFGGNG